MGFLSGFSQLMLPCIFQAGHWMLYDFPVAIKMRVLYNDSNIISIEVTFMTYEDDYSFCRAHMAADEYILWKGKPAITPLLSKSDIFMIPFSIFWCGFAIFWEIGVLSSPTPTFFPIFGIPFVCVGLYLVFGRFIHTAYLRKNTRYVITNKKIIRLQGNRVDYLATSTMPPAHYTANKDGSGTIFFSSGDTRYRHRYNFSFYAAGMGQGIFSLENIPNLVQVQQAIDSMDK